MRQNSLTVSSDKCLFVNFGKTSASSLHPSGQVLKNVDRSKYLGTEKDKKLG